MTMIRLVLTLYALIMSAVFATSAATAETLEQALSKRFPQGSITSVTAAQLALAELDAARREAEQTFDDERLRCYDKFFSASCLSKAKEIRRFAMSSIRKVEVEANAFLRKEKAAERDRVIAERQGRAARPLEGPAIPITGAARDGGAPPESETQPNNP